MEITIKELHNKGFAIARSEGEKAGEMTWSVAGPDKIIIDHTEVNPAFGGRGVGKQLLYAVVEMAREKGRKIIPLCPYANSMFKKIEEIRDVLVAQG